MSSGVSSPSPSSSVPPPTAKRVFLNSSTSDVRLECDAYRSPTRHHQSDDDKDFETSLRKNVKHVFVCLHAHGKLGASRQMLKPHAIMLARGGFIAYNVSFRGCDGNKETSSASLIGDVDARDVLEIVRDVRDRERGEDVDAVKVHIIGYSFGSAVGASAIGLLHEKLLAVGRSNEEEVWSQYGIESLILVAFPLGSLNPFSTTIMGVLSRFLLGKHAARLRKCFVRGSKSHSIARKTRLLFIHGQRDEFTKVKEVRKFCEKLAKGQPEEEDVDDEESNEDDDDDDDNNNNTGIANRLSEFFFGVDDDENSHSNDEEKPVESSYETFGNANAASSSIALLEIKGNKSDHFAFCKMNRHIDLLVKAASRFVL